MNSPTYNSAVDNSAGEDMVTILFQSIKKKFIKADYSYIEKSKGNIARLEGYNDLRNGINFLSKMGQNVTSKEYIELVATFQASITNLTNNSKEFEKAFTNNNSLYMLVYDSTVNALIVGVSLLISESISIYKNEYNILETKVNTDNLTVSKNKYIQLLKHFNKISMNGELAKSFKALNDKSIMKEDFDILNNTAVLNEMTADDWLKIFNQIKMAIKSKKDTKIWKIVKTIGWVVGVMFILLWICRNVVFIYYNQRIKLTQYLEEVAIAVQLNSENISNPKEKERQEKMAERLKELAEKIKVDQAMASNKAERDINASDEEISKEIDKKTKSDTSSTDDSDNEVLV